MYNELNQHKKSDTVKWIISFLLIAVLLAGMIGAWAVILKDKSEEQPQQQEELENDFSSAMKNSEHVVLSMSSFSTLAADNSVSKTITATVLPATATNKAVDWSVEWGEEGNEATVTDYITVTPDSDGSTNATVTCKQAFTGTIVVTATTRESGYQASCVISFIGIPTEMNISGSVSPSGNAYYLGIGSSYVFDVTLTNPFNSIGEKYNNFVCRVEGVGSIVVGYLERTLGVEHWYDEENKNVTIDSLKDSFISVSYENGKLTVTTKKSIESYYSKMQKGDGGRSTFYWDKFRSYVDDCYFKVWIRETNSGLMKELEIRFDKSIVTGINVNHPEMEF